MKIFSTYVLFAAFAFFATAILSTSPARACSPMDDLSYALGGPDCDVSDEVIVRVYPDYVYPDRLTESQMAYYLKQLATPRVVIVPQPRVYYVPTPVYVPTYTYVPSAIKDCTKSGVSCSSAEVRMQIQAERDKKVRAAALRAARLEAARVERARQAALRAAQAAEQRAWAQEMARLCRETENRTGQCSSVR